MQSSLQISMCAAMTMDGRLAPDNLRKMRLGSDQDISFLRNLRDKFQASLMGGQTFRTWPLPPFRNSTDSYLQFVMTKNGLKDVLIDLDIHKWGSNKLILIYGDILVYERELSLCYEKGIESHFVEALCPTTQIQLISEQYLIHRILLEGGGRFCHPFFQNNLIHDIYLTLIPKIMGGEQAQGLCIGKELSTFQKYQIHHVHHHNDEIFIHYKILSPKI